MNETPQLRDALHLGGSRPLIVLVVALVAAAMTVPASLGADTEAESRQILFAAPLAGTDRTPAQIEDFADEVALSTTLPEVADRIEERSGFVSGVDYTRQIERTASDTSLMIVTTADDVGTARTAAQLVGLESVRFVLQHQISRAEALEDALNAELETLRLEKARLTAESGDVPPTAAEERLSQLLFDASREDLTPADDEADADAEPTASVTDLRLELSEIEPLAARYRLIEQQEAQVSSELAGASADHGAANSALESLDSGSVLSEVSTKELSPVPQLIQRALLTMVAVAVLAVIVFWLYDTVRGRRGNGPAASPAPEVKRSTPEEPPIKPRATAPPRLGSRNKADRDDDDDDDEPDSQSEPPVSTRSAAR